METQLDKACGNVSSNSESKGVSANDSQPPPLKLYVQ
jgi:hypothetical protein